ncbi:MAG: DUF3375 domain-containing protein [Sutterella parvirubra]|nr:DUF3375 domain-containing protein [Sutterella parvirubra]MCI7709406.1 DUF3375 domain-containing protein [Sutterella parvirubra]MDY5201313.1 DUF3375 domain-containing protein [Sutterella parvirubra]
MSSARELTARYRTLRDAPMWRLLASQQGPLVIGILQALLYEEERTLPGSVFLERLAPLWAEATLEAVSPEDARALAARFVREGYLVTRLPAGALEEQYELTAGALEAIRILSRALTRRSGPSESRLEMLAHAVVKLAQDADPDPARRIEQLEAEKRRIDEEIAAVKAGARTVLGKDAAQARTGDILELFAELLNDFRSVREEFDRLNLDLRERIMTSEGSRGDVLERFFAGYDEIAQSEAGLAFTGFYRLLTNESASAEMEAALERITQQPFYGELSLRERRTLAQLRSELLSRSMDTHDVMRRLAQSLRQFVESREYVEERRMGQLLREARAAAAAAREDAHQRKTFLELVLPNADIHSPTQYELDDPSVDVENYDVSVAPPPEIDREALAQRIRFAEINYGELRLAVVEALGLAKMEGRGKVSVSEVWSHVPNHQGLGSIVGLLTLAARYGEAAEAAESVDAAEAPESAASDAVLSAAAEALEAVTEAQLTGQDVKAPKTPKAPKRRSKRISALAAAMDEGHLSGGVELSAEGIQAFRADPSAAANDYRGLPMPDVWPSGTDLHGETAPGSLLAPQHETISWTDRAGGDVSAEIPKLVFTTTGVARMMRSARQSAQARGLADPFAR